MRLLKKPCTDFFETDIPPEDKVWCFAYEIDMNLKLLEIETGVHIQAYEQGILKDYELNYNIVDLTNHDYSISNAVVSPGKYIKGAIYLIDYNELYLVDNYKKQYNRHMLRVESFSSWVNAVVYLGKDEFIHEKTNVRRNYWDKFSSTEKFVGYRYLDKIKPKNL